MTCGLPVGAFDGALEGRSDPPPPPELGVCVGDFVIGAKEGEMLGALMGDLLGVLEGFAVIGVDVATVACDGA